ncbi:hypothetical protein CWI42_070190 [Ordospora colligata]|uniref:Uncharacterized protein n=1 Tax=Ordospora colligata OC4 TaxID=1354746 RepID=A0A0B2UJC9_9MICR|nr:uncharacterized protein M896_070190 [Ordospora colligata OC4]KHN69453.1 hypothetical protein M896_070190 [Ordospora colligata OC4]TBU15197.1 hypothetical protein CWI41_070190 [Ordospora colligata]TBU15268.1 hypothetical protein CWI40_070190 [Ordospora colligata]TBU18450.1 hypothetical protein CWI42_070190 [Ordospora colligata]
MSELGIGCKEEDGVSSFKRSMSKMAALEKESLARKNITGPGNLVSIRVDRIEGKIKSPEGNFVEIKKRLFESGMDDNRCMNGISVKCMVENLNEEVTCKNELSDVCDRELMEADTIKTNGVENSKIVEEYKACIKEVMWSEEPMYKEEGCIDDCKEERLENVKRKLLAELDDEKDETSTEMVNMVMQSKDVVTVDVIEQEVEYVDVVQEGSDSDIKQYGMNCNVHVCDAHYKISDLSRGSRSSSQASICTNDIQEQEGSYEGDHNKSEFTETEKDTLDGFVVYQDPDEKPEEKGWFSRLFASVFSMCCFQDRSE